MLLSYFELPGVLVFFLLSDLITNVIISIILPMVWIAKTRKYFPGLWCDEDGDKEESLRNEFYIINYKDKEQTPEENNVENQAETWADPVIPFQDTVQDVNLVV